MFSRVDRVWRSATFWKTMPIPPARTEAHAVRPSTTRPSNRISPRVGRSSPQTRFRIVDLRLPFDR